MWEGGWGARSTSRRKLLEAIAVGSTDGPKKRTWWDPPHTHAPRSIQIRVPYREAICSRS